MAQENHIPYYLEHRDKYIARAKQRYLDNTPRTTFDSFSEKLNKAMGMAESGSITSREIGEIEQDPYFYILNLIKDEPGRDSDSIIRYAKIYGVKMRNTRRPSCRMELTELEGAGYLFHIERGEKKKWLVYFLTDEGKMYTENINYSINLIKTKEVVPEKKKTQPPSNNEWINPSKAPKNARMGGIHGITKSY